MKQMEGIQGGDCLSSAVLLTMTFAASLISGGVFALVLGPVAVGTALDCLAEKK